MRLQAPIINVEFSCNARGGFSSPPSPISSEKNRWMDRENENIPYRVVLTLIFSWMGIYLLKMLVVLLSKW